MADLTTDFLGIKSPNPFWLASAPPTDKEYNVRRAYEAGWGGVVWKTLGAEGPPVVNVNGPRYGVIYGKDRTVLGINNIELITDRPLEVNLEEMARVKADYPDHALIASIMVPCEEEAWKAILPRVEETNADGIELNFGCPHGMAERGMGSAVGQVPEYIEMVTRWCKKYYDRPVIVKLTPNIADIRKPALAAKNGGADAVSLINTINSITSVDLDAMSPEPMIDGKGTHGGYCGPAVKPIAMNMVAEIARDPQTHGLPISGIGGVTTWRDAAEFMALGCGNVQVCTAAMTYGFKIVQEMASGLSQWMDEKGYRSTSDFVGKAVPNVTDWQYLNLNYVTKARIDQDSCISCGRCYAACEDTSHQAICDVGRPDLHGNRRGMRRLQPLRGRLPGRELHLDGRTAARCGGSADWPAGAERIRQLDDPPEQSGGRRGGIKWTGRGPIVIGPRLRSGQNRLPAVFDDQAVAGHPDFFQRVAHRIDKPLRAADVEGLVEIAHQVLQGGFIQFATAVGRVGLVRGDVDRGDAGQAVPRVFEDDVLVGLVRQNERVAGHAFAVVFLEDRNEGCDARACGQKKARSVIRDRAEGTVAGDLIAFAQRRDAGSHAVVVRIAFDHEVEVWGVRLRNHREGTPLVLPAILYQSQFDSLSGFKAEALWSGKGQMMSVVCDGFDILQRQRQCHGVLGPWLGTKPRPEAQGSKTPRSMRSRWVAASSK